MSTHDAIAAAIDAVFAEQRAGLIEGMQAKVKMLLTRRSVDAYEWDRRFFEIVDKRIAELLATEFADAITVIARQAARKRVIAKAKRAGIAPMDLPWPKEAP